MGRRKEFVREDVLRAALKVFWEKGYADASLQDLETATRVNKSGLYAEFESKMELFLTSLKFYLENGGGGPLLSQEPLGLDNVRRFLELGEARTFECRGCFSINSMRELSILPHEAVVLLKRSQAHLRSLIKANIRAARPDADAEALADLSLTFFSGVCIEQNLSTEASVTRRKVQRFMRVLETL